MLLMALDGRFGDLPDAAVFSDTQNEPESVYEWLLALQVEVDPFPIIKCSVGDLGEDYVAGVRRASIPAFSTNQKGEKIMMSRFCSKTYKVEEIMRQIRRLTGQKGQAESWIGISADEAHRGYKPSGVKWLTNRYPLLDAGLHRRDCLAYVEDRMGLRPPKSACVFCPFHGDAQWIDLKRNHPNDFQRAVEFDRRIRDIDCDNWDRPRFLHRSLKPLDQVVFRHEHQLALEGFGNECEGVCGI